MNADDKTESRLRRLEDAVLYLLDRADVYHKAQAKRRRELVKRPDKLREAVNAILASKHERGEQ